MDPLALVTGGSGFLGGYIVSALRGNGWRVVSVARRPQPRASSNIIADLEVGPVQLSEPPDLVVHCAGLAHGADLTGRRAARFMGVNVLGTAHLLDSLKKRRSGPPYRLVLISSVAVYGLDAGEVVTEQQPLLASDPYGVSRVHAEREVRAWSAGSGVPVLILRLPLVVGLDAPGNLGALVRGIRRGRFVNIAGGVARRSMVLASDVARFIVTAAEMDVSGTFHLTDGVHPSYHELSHAVARQLGVRPPYRLPYAAARGLAWTGDLFGLAARRGMPFNSDRFRKMTSTLTFSDVRARSAVPTWSPTGVLDALPDWLPRNSTLA